jgi:hypothetical protein
LRFTKAAHCALVSFGCADPEIEAIIKALPPPGYSGNSLAQLPGWISSRAQRVLNLGFRRSSEGQSSAGAISRRSSTPTRASNPQVTEPLKSPGGQRSRNPPEWLFSFVEQVWKNGAGEGIRTLDPNLGKVVLYP